MRMNIDTLCNIAGFDADKLLIITISQVIQLG